MKEAPKFFFKLLLSSRTLEKILEFPSVNKIFPNIRTAGSTAPGTPYMKKKLLLLFTKKKEEIPDELIERNYAGRSYRVLLK